MAHANAGPIGGLEVRAGPQSLFAFEPASGRLLAGVGWNRYRPWLHPLCTPAGVPVLREFPPDHPFHNGCFVGQHPVRSARGEANFWAVPPERTRHDPVFVRLGRVETEPAIGREALADGGVRLVLRCLWHDERDEPLLEEQRRIEVRRVDDAVLCTVASCKRAAWGPVEFPPTKFGGIAVRLDPRLAPDLGACVLAAGGARGGAEVAHGKPSDFVAFEAGGEPRFGLTLFGDDPALPWFVRDYGLALWNPTGQRAIALGAGESWALAL